MLTPKAVLFDLDDTLAESFQPPTASMKEKLGRLLHAMPVGILTAAGFGRLEKDFLRDMESSSSISNLYLLPNSSAQAYTWNNGWNEEYSIVLSKEERHAIRAAIESVAKNPDPRALILDKEVEIAYVALGMDAPLSEKRAWDPSQEKRKALKKALDAAIPGYEIRIGGMTTIDITKQGVNKAYGVRWLSERLGIPTTDMLFVGDALYEGGNDAVVISTGIRTQSVTGPDETERIIDLILQAQ